jgi:hypothetical protein
LHFSALLILRLVREAMEAFGLAEGTILTEAHELEEKASWLLNS